VKSGLKTSILLRSLIMLLVSLAHCAVAAETTIGFAHVDRNNPYYIAMQKTAYSQAGARGIAIVVLNADNNIATQNSQINALLDKGIKGLIVNSVNEYGTMGAIKRAKSMGVPVVAVDRPLYGDFIGYVGIDQWRAGELQGEYIVDELLPRGGNIVLLLGIPGEPATIGREEGMLNILQHPRNKGRFTILASYRADYSKDLGYQKMKSAISSFGSKIDLVYALNDAMALGALKALREAGLVKLMVVGFYGQKEAYQEIAKGGQFKATVVNNPAEITRKAVDLLLEYLVSGKPSTPVTVITGTTLITVDNVTHYLDPASAF
jgi:ribose transport system substrate-binding protein